MQKIDDAYVFDSTKLVNVLEGLTTRFVDKAGNAFWAAEDYPIDKHNAELDAARKKARNK